MHNRLVAFLKTSRAGNPREVFFVIDNVSCVVVQHYGSTNLLLVVPWFFYRHLGSNEPLFYAKWVR
jgi:hypothetical protein